MLHLILGLCIALLPVLTAALVITRKSSCEIAALRERLAAEEASKRHFMQQSSKHEATIALLYSEQKCLEVDNMLLRSRAIVTDSRVAAA